MGYLGIQGLAGLNGIYVLLGLRRVDASLGFGIFPGALMTRNLNCRAIAATQSNDTWLPLLSCLLSHWVLGIVPTEFIRNRTAQALRHGLSRLR